MVSVDPVEDVKSAVHAQHEEIVTCDGFRFPSFRHHEQLREDRTSLKVDRVSPENLSNGEGVVEDESQDNAGSEQEFYTEGIVVAVVGGLELHEYQIAGSDTACDVDNLHAGVVQRDKAEEEIKISGTEYHGKQSLRFS